ncbi:MAG: hypothetical protein HN348_04580 [Proteobacteria bacterium]|nr:hypothetical protein [Pseudomonadota bacterium]
MSLLPGLSEVFETVEHLLHDGHLPHSEQNEEAQHLEVHNGTLGDEHGCTAMSHTCPCHLGVPGIVADNDTQLFDRCNILLISICDRPCRSTSSAKNQLSSNAVRRRDASSRQTSTNAAVS